jgi:hypothetical protein
MIYYGSPLYVSVISRPGLFLSIVALFGLFAFVASHGPVAIEPSRPASVGGDKVKHANFVAAINKAKIVAVKYCNEHDVQPGKRVDVTTGPEGDGNGDVGGTWHFTCGEANVPSY